MAPLTVKAAKVRECPTVPKRRGAHQNPIKKADEMCGSQKADLFGGEGKFNP